MDRREFLRTSASLLTGPTLFRGQGRQERPNIVLIFADDLGYGSIGAQGSDIPTPNVDSIAKNGVRFTNGYVSCPVCSPTRAGLMTGRYQQRFGHEFNPGPAAAAETNFGLPLSETTVADRLKKAGYATALIGKWHLGYKPELHPQKRGFDEFFGFLGGAHSYVDALADKTNPILRGTEAVDEKSYLTEAFAREAVSFIERRRNDRFFLYLALNAVHGPMHAAEKYMSRFSSTGDERRRTFATMLTAMDEAVGTVIRKLREIGQEDNTLIFFISDNGGPTRNTTSSNAPLRGLKGQALEGGIRVPFLAQWKRRIPAGRTYDQPVITLDVHPTLVTAAGGHIPSNLDGVDLMPYLAGAAKGSPHDKLYWRFGQERAIRMGDWKLLNQGEDAELYNLAQDIGEKNNLAAAQPAKVKELQAAYDAWNSQLAEPRWRSGRKRQRRPALN